MEGILTKLTHHAMNYALRSGIAITASYAFRQSSRLLKNVSGEDRVELLRLQSRLHDKVRIISPAIDMIELIAARGNTSLETSLTLTKSLRLAIQNLGQRLAQAATKEELSRRGALKAKERIDMNQEIKDIIVEIRQLLERIEDAVPLINLAITTSGATLSTSLPATVSPSRLLQASTFLTAGDSQYVMNPGQPVQVGPTFTLSVYMLFAGHARPHDEESIRNTTWKEVIHKARVKIRRVPLDLMFSVSYDSGLRDTYREWQMAGEARGDEFAYQILILEDLDDQRVHTIDNEHEKPGPFDGIDQVGIREVIPIHQISKIFYADTGKILNIGTEGDMNNPVLLLKRDVNAIPPRRMMEQQEEYFNDWDQEYEDESLHSNFRGPLRRSIEHDELQHEVDSQLFHEQDVRHHLNDQSERQWKFPNNLDLEWIAFEVFQEDVNSGSESEVDSEAPEESDTSRPTTPTLTSQVRSLHVHDMRDEQNHRDPPLRQLYAAETTSTNPLLNSIRTSLSLLEMILRLTSLQQFQQQSHLSITDELLNFFLVESSTTGAGGDEQHRQRLRAEARRKVGWDPYDESPVKLRGEDYQYHQGEQGDEEWEAGTAARGGGDARDGQTMSLPNSARWFGSRYSRSPSLPLGSGRWRSPSEQVASAADGPVSPSLAVRASGTSTRRAGTKTLVDHHHIDKAQSKHSEEGKWKGRRH
ncbi:hypothetical protein KEM54_005084 [Ascosphaera aggregata]|nr:hypothetical protein KEM54_005084 [Ascosphaera aggregata]